MFTPGEVEEHLARIERERLQRDMDAMDACDPEMDDLAASEAERRRFEFVKELLAAPARAGNLRRRTGRSWPVWSSALPSTIRKTVSAS